MRYHALACDYDGTIAHHGRVDHVTLAALERLRASGRRLVLVSGRQLEDLHAVFPRLDLFDRAVLENGAVVVEPGHGVITGEVRCLAEPPPSCFVEALDARGVRPLSVGRVIVATWEPHHTVALEVIHELGLELQVVFNKGAVMVLPSGINKAVGLRAALFDLGLSPHNVVGVGDAENDHALFDLCELSVAVANAVPQLKQHADFVTRADHGRGVQELVEELLHEDLRARERRERHTVVLGTAAGDRPVCLSHYEAPLLIAGTSGAGKSQLALALLEQLGEQKYQFCVVDPEGDYTKLARATVLGDEEHAPSFAEMLEVLETPNRSAVANLLALSGEDRLAYFAALLSRVLELRSRTGRPHWLVIDETHLVIPDSFDPAKLTLPKEPHGIVLLTVHPGRVAQPLLDSVGTVVVLGSEPRSALRQIARKLGVTPPDIENVPLPPGRALFWRPRVAHEPPIEFTIRIPRAAHKRHARKYALGELTPDVSFFFRGPHGKLKLRAHNLDMFVRLAEGVDDETWRFHLLCNDYSEWFRERIKDPELADEAHAIERDPSLSATESRERIKLAIERRYAAQP